MERMTCTAARLEGQNSDDAIPDQGGEDGISSL